MNSFSFTTVSFILQFYIAFINGYNEMHDSLAMEILPQLLCTENGDCSTVSLIPADSESTTIWDQDYDRSVNTPTYEDEDTWFHLVANRFQALPPLSQMKTVTPVTNFVRLPDRHAMRPYRHPSRPVDRIPFPFTPTSKIDTISTLPEGDSPLTLRPTQTITTVSTPVNHLVLFKLLLLIAFVAVPIVASTLPIIMPHSQLTRGRRDDVIVNWATHSATLIALAHLASDDRLPDLLKLHDEAFVEALSDAVTTPIKDAGWQSKIDTERSKQRIGESVLKLLKIVKLWDHLRTEDSQEEEDDGIKGEFNNNAIQNGKRLIDFFINHKMVPTKNY